MPPITIDENRARHIFRNADGHFAQDTAVNRQILIDAANRPGNFLGSDRFGNDWFAETRTDGTQIWVRLRGNKITNGGMNPAPKVIDPSGRQS
jgi:hypothetical protein